MADEQEPAPGMFAYIVGFRDALGQLSTAEITAENSVRAVRQVLNANRTALRHCEFAWVRPVIAALEERENEDG